MPKPDEEYTSPPLFDEIDPWSRNLKTEFYKTMADDPYVGNTGEQGPATLMDGFYDRARHERPIMNFVVSRLGRDSLNLVLHDAEISAGKSVEQVEISGLILGSLKRVRPSGEWDASEKSRSLRKSLLADGLLAHINYPIIASAFQLSEVLKLDGHEEYALDAIAATSKWLQRVELKKTGDIKHQTGDPAA